MLYGIKSSADTKPWALTRFAEVQMLLDCNAKHYVCFPSRRGYTVWHFHNVSEKTSALQWNKSVIQLYSWTCAKEGWSGRTRQEKISLGWSECVTSGIVWNVSGITAKLVSSYLPWDCNLLVIVASGNLFTKGRCLNYSWGSFGCETLHINLSKNTVKRGIMGTPIMNAWQTTSVMFMT